MDYKQIAAEAARARVLEIFGVEAEAGFAEGIEAPPDPKLGELAAPCFRLAKQLRLAPPAIAQRLAEGMTPPEGFARVENVGGYLNFFVDREGFARQTVQAAVSQGVAYGGSEEGAGRVIVLDYSSINIMKRFHIGHLSTTMIGHALKRMYTHLGYRCVGVNHLGDWGTQFGKMIAAYRHWGDTVDVEKDGVDALMKLYVRIHEEEERDPALIEEGRAWFRAIEEGDAEAMRLYDWFKEVTLAYAKEVYELLGVEFDSYAGESFYNDKMGRVVDELREKGLLVESQGAYVVPLEDYNMPPCLILKSDGATLYTTRDIAAALYRKDTYDFYKTLYVVAYQQDLHFRQWIKVVELMGYEWAKNLEHVAYGMVSFEGEALSTRKGRTVHLDDLLAQSIDKARAIIEEKSPGLANKDEVARQVGVGAVVFFDLYNNRIKDIDFYFERALAFEGETGPYVQYTHARCCSVLAKAPAKRALPDFAALADDEAQAAVRAVAALPGVIREACLRNEPSMITRHVVDIAQAYNHYYYERRILGDDPAGTAARLLLTEAVRNAIRLSLYLIGIDAPEKM